jgi:DNA (cytosine-5)-methyltransferase 1
MNSRSDHPFALAAPAPRVLNLFCGAGGLAEGFRQAGFEIVAGVDWDHNALATFRRNHPTAATIAGDIREIESIRLAEHGPVDVLIGGPSCQGYSTHGKRIFDDPRNFLFREFARVTRDLQPPWLVIENVKGMLSFKRGLFRRWIYEAFEEMGYRFESRLMLAAEYGVPQLRQRIVFIGTRTDLPIRFPDPTHGTNAELPWVSVGDATGDLPALGDGGGSPVCAYDRPPTTDYQRWARTASSALTLHNCRPVSPLAMSIIRRIPMGKGIRHLSEHELPERFRRMRTISNGNLRRDCTTLYYRADWNRPSYTITCYFRNVSAGPFVHPHENRAFTPREAARLQSFQDSYEFVGTAVPRQIGNAVPPLLGRAIASAVRRSMDGVDHDDQEKDEMLQLAFA